jgi:DNA polymerase type B, organellar and viral
MKGHSMTREWINDPRNRQYQRFCGVDGEGGNIPDPAALFGEVHSYLLLRAGEFKLEDPQGLQFEHCAAFLSKLPHDRIYVSYFFDYDSTMMLKSLPAERVQRVFDRHKRVKNGQIMPVDWEDYQFDYLPHKEFKVRQRTNGQWGQFTTISDVGQFFQSAFLTTLEKWGIGTEEEREMIRKGKAQRADFTGVTDEIRAYNALEILLLERLMSEFRAVCVDTEYIPRKWQGPGYLASAMLDYHKVPKRKHIPIMMNDEFRRIANDAYYGGRFETTAAGPIQGPVYQYDINSAYPSVLRTLPCLTHGSWRRIRDIPDSGLWFGQVYFNHATRRILYNLPVRTKEGNIFYPKEGNGVYWSTELEAAQRAGTRLSFSTGWIYERHCECRWFDFIDDYYTRRLALGKSNKGIVLKLAGNSIYGKLAQSIGYAPYANPVWAGLITAGCRAQIINGYSQSPDHTYMIATDGIFVGEKLDLPVSKKLGEWEETEHDNGIFIVQPGIYYVSDGSVKTRGVERGRINQKREDFQDAWQRFLDSHGENHTVSVDVDNFITARQALARRKWSIAGHWEHDKRQISFDWSVKRQRATAFHDGRAIRTVPHLGNRNLFSVGYDRLIGGEARSGVLDRYRDPGLIEAQRMEEQPDWVEPLISLPKSYQIGKHPGIGSVIVDATP